MCTLLSLQICEQCSEKKIYLIQADFEKTKCSFKIQYIFVTLNSNRLYQLLFEEKKCSGIFSDVSEEKKLRLM